MLTLNFNGYSLELERYLKLEYSFSLPLGSESRNYFSYILNNDLSIVSPKLTKKYVNNLRWYTICEINGPNTINCSSPNCNLVLIREMTLNLCSFSQGKDEIFLNIFVQDTLKMWGFFFTIMEYYNGIFSYNNGIL